MRTILAAAALLLGASVARAEGESCLPCHQGLQDPKLSEPARKFAGDVHAKHGLGCTSCHGGDASPSRQEHAHAAEKGFLVPRGAAVVATCAKCHSDPAFMKKYNPAARTDQESLYRESHHGKKLAAGDAKAATCVSCHGNHGILPVKDPGSPVYPLQVPETCGKCHGSAEYMKGRSIPTDVLEKYRGSVHGKALLGRKDTGAPACNSCHGNHGAAPPEVASVAHVCGTCHGQQADLFRASKKKANFDENGLAECSFCHSHHDIQSPSDAMLGTGKESICLQCHEDQDDAGFVTAKKWEAAFKGFKDRLAEADHVLEKAEQKGMEVSESQFHLTEARDHLTQARVLIHSYDEKPVLEALAAGEKVAVAAKAGGDDALVQFDYRRRGLYWSLGAIALLAVGIWFKIRDLDRRLPPE